MPEPTIRVRGAGTHNLRHVDLDLPYGKLIVLCGVSGSGKSSLAVDTLYAEGQRRYVETFSTFARQFLEQLPRPDVEHIEGLPPPILIKDAGKTPGRRATVGTATAIYDHLRLLFARFGDVVCPTCARPVRRHGLAEAAEYVQRLPEGARLVIAFAAEAEPDSGVPNRAFWEQLLSAGFRRAVIGHRVVEIETPVPGANASLPSSASESIDVIVDRLVAGRVEPSRVMESLETAQLQGSGACLVYVEASDAAQSLLAPLEPESLDVDGRTFLKCAVSDQLVCGGCGKSFPDLDPQLFNFSSPHGACPACEGLGAVREDARPASGARRWRTCPSCGGQRLKPEALAVHVGGKSVAEIVELPATRLADLVQQLTSADEAAGDAGPLVEHIQRRIEALLELRIGYLSLARSLRSLSRGERQRVALAAATASSLVSAIYILDEPTTGLHAADSEAVIASLKRLRDRGNTVLTVEHDAQVLRSADWLIELGPGAGQEGGRIVFQGSPKELVRAESSVTGDWLAGRRGRVHAHHRRPTDRGWIRLVGARAKNLQGINVEFPLNVLCVVTGVSGAGKTALVLESLYPAVLQQLGGAKAADATWQEIQGVRQVEHLELVDQSPPARTLRSNPITYVKAFDAIRRVFAETIDAKTHNYGPGFFSFNVPGGRCEKCKGEGRLTIDMQFLPDLHVACPECNGRRYRREALAVHFRNHSIADVLELTVREAMTFFRGQPAVQSRLQCLKDAGLDYLQLGQPAGTLSGGEAQRLKLAAFLQARRGGRTLFLLDEPTAGLHAVDVLKLLDCFDDLLSVGHSLVAVTHHLDLVRAADHVIELGPGAGAEGGLVVTAGTPEDVAAHATSVTGRILRQTTERFSG